MAILERLMIVDLQNPKSPKEVGRESATTPSDFMTTTASRAVSNTKRRASCGAAGSRELGSALAVIAMVSPV